ncbi:CsbD family protein [Sulfitobacter pacificus]|uniref:CsbD family protein n=1 Tax=Sulfitobacter pacificus TaxID=1499314 RepID=A0ABQ5VJS0_9RHOB|nr:CsbD family protein [Sulfitobacter pacificus]GLQ27345.1 CsbD family protein [Sulfitobacter pacificus]
MNWDQIKGEWKIMKGKARSKWGELTDDELDEAAGEREQLEGLIQKRYGKTKEEAKAEVDSWMNES